jgi:hypothetical protein
MFALVAKSGLIPSSSVDSIIRLAKVFPEWPTAQLADMQHQVGLSKLKGVKASLTVHRPSRRQVLITISPVPVGFNPANLLDHIHTTLGLHHSQLVVHSVSASAGGFLVATGSVASGDNVSHILEATRVVFPAAMKADAALPSSTSYLKLVDMLYIMNNKDVTPDGILTHIACTRVKDLVILQGPLQVVVYHIYCTNVCICERTRSHTLAEASEKLLPSSQEVISLTLLAIDSAKARALDDDECMTICSATNGSSDIPLIEGGPKGAGVQGLEGA